MKVIQIDNILALNKNRRDRRGRDLRATRLNPVSVFEVIIGLIVVIAVVIQGRILGFAAVEIVVEGIDVVGVVHVILRLHRGNLRERGIEEAIIGMQRKGEKSRARELGSGRRKEKNARVPLASIFVWFFGEAKGRKGEREKIWL